MDKQSSNYGIETVSLANDYFITNQRAIIDDYFSLLRFPSISAQPEFQDQVRSCALWLQNWLEAVGLTTQLWETNSHPTVYAEWKHSNSAAPTVIIYNHYDVQPVDPVTLWESPPFEPSLDNGQVFARGAVDDKGQLVYVLHALKMLLEKEQHLPLNIKLIIEGEEEIGSQNFSTLITDHQEELKGDFLLVVDSGYRDLQQPAISLGCRGLVTIKVELTGSNTDLHSGEHGGIVYNPLHALVELLSQLRDPSTGTVIVPGFYSDIKELTKEEKEQIDFRFDTALYEESLDTLACGGEKELPPLEKLWLRPTLEINGITGGYCGEGFKTVIPAKATAHLSCRIVPNQCPADIFDKVASFLKKRCPAGVNIKVTSASGHGQPMRCSPSSTLAKIVAEAYSTVCGSPCSLIFTGGTIAAAPLLAKAANAEAVFTGFCLPEDKIHAPNENFSLHRLQLGLSSTALILKRLGGL